MAVEVTRTSLSTLDAILKTQYLPVLNEQLNNATVLFSRLEKDYDSVVGKNFTMALHTDYNLSVAARTEGATLPTAGTQVYTNATVPMKYLYGGISLTGQTLKAAKVSEGAYIQALDSEMKGLMTDFKRSLNKQVWGDGTGLLATCGTSGPSTTVLVDSTANLRVNQRIDITTITSGATGAGALGAYVESITDATHFVCSASVNVTNALAVYREGSRTIVSGAGVGIECMGMNGIFSATSVLQGLDPATSTYWKANVIAHNIAISETIMQRAFDTTETNSDGEATAIYTTHGVRRSYQALLAGKKQYVNPLQLKGGWTALDYNGIPLIVDKDAPSGKVFFANENALKFYRLSDLEWMEEDGAILNRVSGVDAYSAVLFLYHELATTMRNSQTVVTGVTETTA